MRLHPPKTNAAMLRVSRARIVLANTAILVPACFSLLPPGPAFLLSAGLIGYALPCIRTIAAAAREARIPAQILLRTSSPARTWIDNLRRSTFYGSQAVCALIGYLRADIADEASAPHNAALLATYGLTPDWSNAQVRALYAQGRHEGAAAAWAFAERLFPDRREFCDVLAIAFVASHRPGGDHEPQIRERLNTLLRLDPAVVPAVTALIAELNRGARRTEIPTC